MPPPRHRSMRDIRQWPRSTSAALKVRLEVNVVTHLLVDLQAVALTVGHDDLISLGIEDHGRREAETPELLQILHAPVRLHHIGCRLLLQKTPLLHHTS